MNKHFILLTALLGTLSGSVGAQRPARTVDELYAEGKQLYLRQHYAAAQQTLEDYLQQPMAGEADRARAIEAEYMTVCAAYYLKSADRFDRILNYLVKYPDTPHANRLHALAGNVLYADGMYERALDCYGRAALEKLGNDDRDEATLYKAICLLKTGDVQEAYALLTVVQSVSAEREADARYYKAYIDYTYRRYDEALSALETLTGHDVYGRQAPYYIADIHLQQKQYDEALRTVEAFLTQYPEAEQTLEMKRIAGEAAYGMEQYAQAATMLDEYVQGVEAPQRNALYKLGISQLKQGVCTNAALNLTRSATERDALAQNAYLHSGLAYVQLLDMVKARMAFEQASSMDFDKVVKEQALYNYALCIHETAYTGFGESVTVFERFLNEFPSSPYADQVNDYLVEVYMNTRSYKTALASIAKIKQPGVRILEARQKINYRLGTEAFANADYPAAQAYFNESLQDARYNRDTQADTYFWRGETRYRMGNWNGAAADYLQYLSTTTTNPNQQATAYYNLGYTAFQQKNYAKARGYFDRLLSEMRSAVTPQMVADALNRKADCLFYARDFSGAARTYSEATATDPSQGDYALYQQAFVQGLQKDYQGKVASLNTMIDRFPQSTYVDDALYERGRAYVQMEQNTQAIASFKELTERFPESALARKAASEIGMLYYQDDHYNEAIAAYKQVIEKYPGSEEARMAGRDLKSIYIEQNRVDDYAAYAAQQKGSISFDTNERDSLTYLAAEKVYMRGDMQEAEKSMAAYLQSFPEGAYRLNAHYYLGVAAYEKKDAVTALSHFDKVLEYPHNKYSEEATTMAAELAYNSKDYTRALTLYKLLKGKTTSADRLLMARTGILRSAHLSGDGAEVIAAATELLADNKTAPELANEARYYRSRAAAKAGNRELAGKDLEELAKDTRHLYGAEAKYRLAEMHYSAKDYADAEKVLLNYIEVSTPHTYWLARSFVLLSDVYMQTGREIEAKQYLLSLQQNYTASDDIAGMIEERLSRMKN